MNSTHVFIAFILFLLSWLSRDIEHKGESFGSVPKCIESNNGKEICDGIDNDCNGMIDEVVVNDELRLCP